MMIMALALLAEGCHDRKLYLFDTFAGMPEPQEKDIEYTGVPASAIFSKTKLSKESSTWTNATVDEVKEAMALTGYPMDKVHFIKGMVENTIPENAPKAIALLRLDTDFYQSTKHELVHLYPIVSSKGIILIDDYGHYKGCKQAVDEYLSENRIHSYLHRIDYTGRLLIK